MGCCGKVKTIAGAMKNMIIGKDFEYTAAARLICRNCEFNRWMGVRGICGKCHCFLPAKIRQTPKSRIVINEKDEEETVKTLVLSCPIGKWDSLMKGAKNEKVSDLDDTLSIAGVQHSRVSSRKR